MKRLAVYCGSASPENPRYEELAMEIGEALALRGIGVVYGGGKLGLMGAVAAGALLAGGDSAHQAELAAAVDHADAAAGEGVADLHRQLLVARVLGAGRAAIDREALHLVKSLIISPAVALAPATTPGIPAPGCVPAPTR